jgi:anti-sigma factor ChrR (cupin superfamily)
MRINADFSQRVIIETEAQDWVETRATGVRRRMLDRDGAEAGRATTVVSFAAESYFPGHRHDGGEEFFVLEGVFSDESGDYGPGMYVRNPVGSAHVPGTKDGCILYVKLCQMDAADKEYVRIDTNLDQGWQAGAVEGLSVRPLHQYGDEKVSLVRWQPGVHYPRHEHPGGEEVLVVDGALQDENGSYPKRTWLRLPPGSHHAPFSAAGCTLLVKTGHLNAEMGA